MHPPYSHRRSHTSRTTYRSGWPRHSCDRRISGVTLVLPGVRSAAGVRDSPAGGVCAPWRRASARPTTRCAATSGIAPGCKRSCRRGSGGSNTAPGRRRCGRCSRRHGGPADRRYYIAAPQDYLGATRPTVTVADTGSRAQVTHEGHMQIRPLARLVGQRQREACGGDLAHQRPSRIIVERHEGAGSSVSFDTT